MHMYIYETKVKFIMLVVYLKWEEILEKIVFFGTLLKICEDVRRC